MELLDKLANLKIESKINDSIQDLYEHKTLQFAAWTSPPTLAHVAPLQSVDDIQALIREGPLLLKADTEQMPKLLPKRTIVVNPCQKRVPPEPKPNLLVITLLILDHCRRQNPKKQLKKADALKALREFDVIMPRNPLKKIMSSSMSKQQWMVYAMRPTADLPMYINRVRSYETNPSSIGMLFEKACCSSPEVGYHRIYSVGRGTFRTTQQGGLVIGLTGELDGLDTNGHALEIKTRPAWARPGSIHDGRVLDTWIQSVLAGVGTIVTGSFNQTRGDRTAPVIFSASKITHQSLDEFSKTVRGKTEALEYGEQVLSCIMKECTEVGTVYEISGSYDSDIEIQKLNDDTEFPITKETIENCLHTMCV